MGDPSCAGHQLSDFVRPLWQSGSPTIATSGAAFVRGSKWESYARQLFVAQLKESDLRRFAIVDGGFDAEERATYYNGRWGRLRAVVLGPGNRLYITTSNSFNGSKVDRVIRITPS
jgi:glucose/arabinose dehydrogenase